MRFIDGKIVISNRTKQNLIEQLIEGKYPTMSGINEGIDNWDDIEDNDFDYLIKMPIYNLTKERIEELKKEKITKL